MLRHRIITKTWHSFKHLKAKDKRKLEATYARKDYKLRSNYDIMNPLYNVSPNLNVPDSLFSDEENKLLALIDGSRYPKLKNLIRNRIYNEKYSFFYAKNPQALFNACELAYFDRMATLYATYKRIYKATDKQIDLVKSVIFSDFARSYNLFMNSERVKLYKRQTHRVKELRRLLFYIKPVKKKYKKLKYKGNRYHNYPLRQSLYARRRERALKKKVFNYVKKKKKEKKYYNEVDVLCIQYLY